MLNIYNTNINAAYQIRFEMLLHLRFNFTDKSETILVAKHRRSVVGVQGLKAPKF